MFPFAAFPTTSTSSSTTPPHDDDVPDSMERRLKKPLMERKRRERINTSLNALKEILVDAVPQQTSKLEKADILELTVSYIRRLQAERGGDGGAFSLSKEESAALLRRGYEMGWASTGRVAQQYLCAVMPPESGPHAQQIHLGLLAQLRHAQMPAISQAATTSAPASRHKNVSPPPAAEAVSKGSPTSPDSAYGSPDTGTTAFKASSRPDATPLSRPTVPADEDSADCDSDDSDTQPDTKRSKIWRPFGDHN